MALAFLNPWFWIAAVAVAAPLWLHLRRRRERNLIKFSAVRFLADQPRARRSPFRLEDPLLLLLRALAVLLIAAAFAWPYLRRSTGADISESVVYILDNTLSHQANGGFSADRNRLVQEFDRAGPKAQLAVVELRSAPRIVAGFGQDRAAAKQVIGQLSPSFERGSYLAAFREANTLLSAAPGRHKRIVLLGDSQANQWSEEGSAPPFLRDIQVDLPRAGSSPQPNLWLSDFRGRRLFLGNQSKVHFTLRLGHLGAAQSGRVQLQVNGQTVFNREVDLRNQPQSILLQAECEADSASWVQAEATVEGTPDALPADNQVFVSVPPVAEGKVALLAQSPYLRLAFSPEIMRGQWSSRALEPSNLAAELGGSNATDVLCMESRFLQRPEARSLVKGCLADGRGVFLIVNSLSPAIDGALRELGFEAEGMVEPSQPERFQFVLSSHSIFRPFQSPDFGKLLAIEVARYARLHATAGRPLIFSQSGDGLFFEGTGNRGKLFICAFGLDRDQSSWPVDPTFIPFLDRTLQSARPQDATRFAYKPGETALVRIPLGKVARAAVLRQGQRELLRVRVQHGGAQVRLPGTPGLYALTMDDRHEVEQVFSVNPDPKESELEFVDVPKALKAWSLAPGDKKPVSIATGGVGFSGILQQRLWWWMVVGGLVALAFESAWAAAKGETA